jgi:transposase
MDLKLTVLRKEAKAWRKVCPRITFRLIALIELVKRQQTHGLRRLKDLDYELIGTKLGVSGRSVRRWKKAYEQGGAERLLPRPIKGRPPQVVRGHAAALILEWRRKYCWGAQVIGAHLLHDHGIRLSRHKIERYLRAKGLIRKIRRKKKSKHTRVVKIAHPGQFTQIDVKYLTKTLKNGSRAYVYTFIDHASKWRFKRAYEMFGNLQTKMFVEELSNHLPFQVLCLQSDNGAEFTNRFLSHLDAPREHLLDHWCKQNGVRHKLIPPGEKELQGLVERNHRQDDEELYHRIAGTVETLSGLNRLLDEHRQWCNAKRRRKALDWKTSDQWLAEYCRAQETPVSSDTQDENALPKAA